VGLISAGRGTVRRAWQRHWVRWGLLVAVLAMVAAVLPWVVVRVSTLDDLHDDPRAVPAAPVALVLGAGLDGAGNLSPFLADRVTTAVRLYRAGRVRALLMSGDNSRHDYDEVGAMAAEAERLGVPASAIAQDHAGFDTFSSCYRARWVWGVRRTVVVSQPFHLPRAVWICRSLGIDTAGAQAGSPEREATLYGWLREVPAVDKAVLDVWRGRLPTFPGPREHALDAVNAAG